MKKKIYPSQKYLHRLLDYNPETGIFIWKKRPLEMFDDLRIANIWNTRFAGRRAGVKQKETHRCISIEGIRFSVSRLAWIYVYGSDPNTPHIYFKDGNHLNNAITNLCPATHKQIQSIRKKDRDCKYDLPKGVRYNCNKKRFVARLVKNGRQTHLGVYNNVEEADRAYKAASAEYFAA